MAGGIAVGKGSAGEWVPERRAVEQLIKLQCIYIRNKSGKEMPHRFLFLHSGGYILVQPRGPSPVGVNGTALSHLVRIQPASLPKSFDI